MSASKNRLTFEIPTHWKLGFGLLAATIIPAAISNDACAATIQVPGDHSTIQAAVDAAAPSDEIRVEDGTYIENVTINKTLKIQGSSKTYVRASNDNTTVFTIAADNVELKRLRIRGGVHGVIAQNVERPRLMYLRVRAASSDGIMLSNTNRALVFECRSYENGASGIHLDFNLPGNVSVVKRCRSFRNVEHGVLVEQGFGNKVTETRTFENALTGIRVEDTFNARLTDNRSWRNAIGISVIATSTEAVVEDNIIFDNEFAGFVYGRSTGVAKNNLSKRNQTGFSGGDEADWLLQANRARENTGDGFSIDGTANQYVDNESTDNLGSGFVVTAGERNQLTVNLARGNGQHGFLVANDGESGNVLQSNVSTQNDGDGFRTTEETFGNEFHDNFADVNGGFGYVDIGSNVFSGNQCGGGNGDGPSSPAGLCD